MDLLNALLVAVGSGAVSGLISWGGIRADLRSLREGLSEAKEIGNNAHRRVDQMLMEKNHA